MTYSDYNINIPNGKYTGQVYTTCPKCSHERKKKTDKCLGVNLDKQVWHCNHCNWKGWLPKQIAIDEKVYVKPEWKKLFYDMFSKWSPSFLRWAMHAVLHWKNTEPINNYTHIHGDRDIVFPIRFINDYKLIKNGTHVMVLSRAREIRTIIISKLAS